MEDDSYLEDEFTDEKDSLFIVYDGHGGNQTVSFLKEKLPKLLYKLMSARDLETISNNTELSTFVKSCFSKAFTEANQELKLLGCVDSGATATVVYIRQMYDSTCRVFCANVGDSNS
mmetsp:Transcript_46535/g.101612  ORF Transcript_46535/g.101612 Transcript_46535/m.101612 type:complete len:117 (+) Transcript_46535:148-498(+)|eukprot:CAMPEP_0116939968 /NCGR_PEP_ID=MMETSP0467-20121206/33077_1 /TAXON_ID=283647 /ORGANISM="Mesodinium pulex, Strain SPMC105" /LENGTH=116 /DNA_ID=CAMNT_0004622399 /DNA_START=108 /DNA_END=458 /DNA_ORIENTATION=+